MSKLLRSFMYVFLLGTFMVTVNACNKDDDPIAVGFGTISGTVTDEAGQALSGVTVTVSGVNEDDVSVTSGDDGKYIVQNVSMKTHAVNFSKEGWLTIGVTVTADEFDDNNMATADAAMVSASAKIAGTIRDAKNGGALLAGVTVSVGTAGTVTSGSDGKYVIENLVVDNYTVTFKKANYVDVVEEITAEDFENDLATLDIVMGGTELLRGLTAADLADADKWYYNEYRGGGNGYAYPHWDWSTDYMAALDFQGAWQEQSEGTTLQIRNGEEDQDNPADLDVFDSYVYGSKLITEDNKILSLRVRTHNADESAPAYFGVQVVDLSAEDPVAVKIGDNRTHGSGDYADYEFDLSDYVGKEVIIAIGIYRQATGDYWKQLVLRAIRFANQKVENSDWLPGTEVIPGWQLTREMVNSTMLQTKTSFTGISPISGDSHNYADAYRSWRDIPHVATEWTFVPLKKDPEPFAGEGYVIKTNGKTPVNTVVPEAYFYAKFAIASGNNQLTLKTRNFQSGSAPDHYTYFKLTAVKEDGTVVHIEPTSNTAEDASAAADHCWKFKHYHGSKDDPESYASFVYDLSQFNGNNVVLVFGVYQGLVNTSENKLAFYSIDLN